MLGVSIAFTYIYVSIDLLQCIIDWTYALSLKSFNRASIGKQAPQIIVTNIQLYLLLTVSFVVGSIFGAIFGFVNVEEYSKSPIILYVVL